MDRASSFHAQSAALERTWTEDVTEGVPEASMTRMHMHSTRRRYLHASGWSPMWWFDDGSSFLGTLHHQTDAGMDGRDAVAGVRRKRR